MILIPRGFGKKDGRKELEGILKAKSPSGTQEGQNTMNTPDDIEQLKVRLEAAEKALSKGSIPLSETARVSIRVCIAAGVLCITSSVLKTWCAAHSWLDFAILFSGVALCAMPLFRRIKVGIDGCEMSRGEVLNLVRATRDTIIRCSTPR